ncbi:hypothetical protein OIU85_003861, partial [Salix viminalis]
FHILNWNPCRHYLGLAKVFHHMFLILFQMMHGILSFNVYKLIQMTGLLLLCS